MAQTSARDRSDKKGKLLTHLKEPKVESSSCKSPAWWTVQGPRSPRSELSASPSLCSHHHLPDSEREPQGVLQSKKGCTLYRRLNKHKEKLQKKEPVYSTHCGGGWSQGQSTGLISQTNGEQGGIRGLSCYTGFEDGRRWPPTQKRGQPLEAREGKGKEMDSPLESPERNTVLPTSWF